MGGLKIWNYNKGIIDCTKGVQQLQVLVNQEIKFNGRLDPGKGNTQIDYSKKIVISKISSFAFPEEPQLIQQNILQVASNTQSSNQLANTNKNSLQSI